MGKIIFKRPMLVQGTTVPQTAYTLPVATTSVIGGVKQATVIADSVQVTAPTTAEFNALLAALRTAGILATS